MVFPNDLPTCSVQRRHALAERARVLGLPPSDSVLRRHYEQMLRTQQPAPAAAAPQVARPAPAPAVAAAAAAAPARAPAPAPAPARAPAAAPAPASSGGGLMGWLRRLFGG